jgi:hypothetical protein
MRDIPSFHWVICGLLGYYLYDLIASWHFTRTGDDLVFNYVVANLTHWLVALAVTIVACVLLARGKWNEFAASGIAAVMLLSTVPLLQKAPGFSIVFRALYLPKLVALRSLGCPKNTKERDVCYYYDDGHTSRWVVYYPDGQTPVVEPYVSSAQHICCGYYLEKTYSGWG